MCGCVRCFCLPANEIHRQRYIPRRQVTDFKPFERKTLIISALIHGGIRGFIENTTSAPIDYEQHLKNTETRRIGQNYLNRPDRSHWRPLWEQRGYGKASVHADKEAHSIFPAAAERHRHRCTWATPSTKP